MLPSYVYHLYVKSVRDAQHLISVSKRGVDVKEEVDPEIITATVKTLDKVNMED